MSQPPYPQPPAPGDPNSGYPTPGYPAPGYPAPGYPAPGYPAPGYGPPAGQYPGYQNQLPSGYGVGGGMPPPPPGWGAPPPPQALARPNTVTYAMIALLANLAVGVGSAILVFANRDAFLDAAFIEAGLGPDTQLGSDVVDAGYRLGAIIGLIFVALWALFLWFAWKGHNWARIVIWVLGGLSLFSVFGALSAPVGSIVAVNVLGLLLVATAVVLLALKPSNDWYRYQADARRYNWPGRA